MIYKKLLLLAFLLLGVSNVAYSKFYLKHSVYYNGFWGDWKEFRDCTLKGDYNGFYLYEDTKHPSEYFFKFEITGYVAPSKKEIKQHYKANTWWEYKGYVEYYICDVYPTVVDVIKEKGRLLRDYDLLFSEYDRRLATLKASKMTRGENYSPIGFKRIRKSATIKIAPYKKVPQCYNIYFDGGGYAIDLNNLKFEGGKSIQVIHW